MWPLVASINLIIFTTSPYLSDDQIILLTMEVHDYEYYEARAKDVKFEDITSDEDNADLLARLRRDNDDPYAKYFTIVTERDENCDFVVREGDHLGWVGYFVGKSEKLETLCIDNFPDNININAFLEGLGRNRLIKELRISKDLGEGFQSLIPFLKNNDSLQELRFGYFDVGLQCARNIALLLSQQSSLKCLTFDETYVDGEGFVQITAALRRQPQIEELYLWNDSDFAIDNDIGDEGLQLDVLATGLKHCPNLTSVTLFGNLMVTEEGLRSLTTVFQSDNCRLEDLSLGELNIGDDGMAVLAIGLASLPTLKRLNLSGTSIGDKGLQDFVRALVNCNLEELGISHMLSVSGSRLLGTFLQSSTSMRSLSLKGSIIADEGIQSLVDGMANCCSLTDLKLRHNHLITSNGLSSLTTLLRAEQCSLRTLEFFDIHLDHDEVAVVLANDLIGNKSLETLYISVSDIAARGWAAFSRLLCDTSSVNNTYLSNHTLGHMGMYGLDGTPSDIVEVLKLNKTLKQSAAICKILRSHPDIDVTPLFEFNLKCLPLVVEWLEKAKSYLRNLNTSCCESTKSYLDKVNESSATFLCRKLSAVYKFIRGMPQLAVNGYRSQKMKDVKLQSKSRKRTIDQTL